MDKEALDSADFLKWLLGAAMVGAGARGAFSVGRQIFPPKTIKKQDLTTDEIRVPVDLTPEQLARYEARTKQLYDQGEKTSSEKQAGPWDNTLYMLGAMGGTGVGWVLADKLLKNMRNKQLDKELENAREELNRLTQMGPDPQTQDTPEPQQDGPTIDQTSLPELQQDGQDYKQAQEMVFGDWLMGISQTYKEASDALEESTRMIIRGIGGTEKQAASYGRIAHKNLPLLLGAGGVAGLGLASAIPLVRNGVNAVGGATAGTAGGAVSSLLKPLGYGAASVLGPVAALFGLVSMIKSYQAGRGGSKKRQELDEFRKLVRRGQAIDSPYVRLEARRSKKKEEDAPPTSTDDRMDINAKYSRALDILDKRATITRTDLGSILSAQGSQLQDRAPLQQDDPTTVPAPTPQMDVLSSQSQAARANREMLNPGPAAPGGQPTPGGPPAPGGQPTPGGPPTGNPGTMSIPRSTVPVNPKLQTHRPAGVQPGMPSMQG